LATLKSFKHHCSKTRSQC